MTYKTAMEWFIARFPNAKRIPKDALKEIIWDYYRVEEKEGNKKIADKILNKILFDRGEGGRDFTKDKKVKFKGLDDYE